MTSHSKNDFWKKKSKIKIERTIRTSQTLVHLEACKNLLQNFFQLCPSEYNFVGYADTWIKEKERRLSNASI